MTIIDFHTHAFPDKLASRALAELGQASNVQPQTDGTVGGLLGLMDQCGVDRAVVLSIATKPAQFQPILDWSLSVRSERIIPFASVHPGGDHVGTQVEAIAAAGLRGIKLHPHYQAFEADDRAVYPLYEAVEASGLVLLMHAGLDIAFGEADPVGPERLRRVIEDFPRLKLVLAHLGGWRRIEGVLEQLAGLDLWLDASFSKGYITDEQLRTLLARHSTDRILFASDAPWGGMQSHIDFVRSWPISDDVCQKILYRNAEALLADS